MKKHRIQTKRPDYSHKFNIHNGSATRPFTWWEINSDYETLCSIQNLYDGEVAAYLKLNTMLRIAGSHATLWISDWQGTIAPMDVQPQGWCYPNGEPIEPEWWWQWHPAPDTAAAIVARLEAGPFAQDETSPLKSGVPYQFQRRQGQTQAVEAIPIQQLPNLVRSAAPWIFEFNR